LELFAPLSALGGAKVVVASLHFIACIAVQCSASGLAATMQRGIDSYPLPHF
jgi:hypothetical protein